MIIASLSLSWLLGILLGAIVDLPLWAALTGLLPLALAGFNRRYARTLLISGLSLALLFAGAWYFDARQTGLKGEAFEQLTGERVTLQGTLLRRPETGSDITRLYISVAQAKTGDEWQKITGQVLVFAPGFADYRYGDVLAVTGRLETPPELDGFDYRRYLADRGVYRVMRYPAIESIGSGGGLAPVRWVYSLREQLSRSLARLLPEPQASLAQGMVLGGREQVPGDLKEAFTRTGTAHLLAISGQQLTIVAGILLSLGGWLIGRRRGIHAWLALGVTWLYTVLTGMEPPVVRAAVMLSIFLTAELLGRQRSAPIALLVAAVAMTAATPRLLWDAAFQMSFTAIAGLLFIYPLLREAGKSLIRRWLGEDGIKVRLAGLLNEALCVNLGALLAVSPLIVHYFGIFSWTGLPATFFAVPALPFIMVAGLAAGFIGIIFLPLAQVAAWLAWLALSYLLLVVRLFDHVPVLEVPPPQAGVVLYYALLAAILLFVRYRRRLAPFFSRVGLLAQRVPLKWVATGLLPPALLASFAAVTMPDAKLHVSFLDVGQGDAVLIQQGSRQILVDGGPSGTALSHELGRKMPFWDRTIDLVILTHPHADHLTGLLEIVQRYRVSRVMIADTGDGSALWSEWQGLLERRKIDPIEARAGQSVSLGQARLEVLYSPGPESEGDANESSLVLSLERGDISFLLAGDIGAATELELVTVRAVAHYTVLKVPHHGSAGSSTPPFLAIVRPDIAVISAGKGNPFNHPSPEVIERLGQQPGTAGVYRTDRDGTIELVTDGSSLWLRTGK